MDDRQTLSSIRSQDYDVPVASVGGFSAGRGSTIRCGAGAGFDVTSVRAFIIAWNFWTLSGACAAPVRSCLANAASLFGWRMCPRTESNKRTARAALELAPKDVQ
jgi:hypothetical protein